MARAFIIRPFGVKRDSAGNPIDFEKIDSELIRPALAATSFGGSTTGAVIDSGYIREDIFTLILEADLVICDITVYNATVFYELGIRHALRTKHTILIKGNPTADITPFDRLTDRYLVYDVNRPEDTKDPLIKLIEAALKNNRTDSPIFQMFPALPEADQYKVQLVPPDFREEVERATAARSKGWLRLLAEEVQTLRFKYGGLRTVGIAQWSIRDYGGARESLEEIRKVNPDDIEANLAQSNIYERLYRLTHNLELLEVSDQAIKRVLANEGATREQRVEALALKGRNQKTRWRLEFMEFHSLDERRKAAMNMALLESYDAYREAFDQDLNSFYPGLAALQMGTIFLDLTERNDAWMDMFDNDAEADYYKGKLTKNIQNLQVIVPASLDAGLRRLAPTDPSRVWAEITRADILFLTMENEKRIRRTYEAAIPQDNPFAWDAVRGQLMLFASLGLKAGIANSVITDLDSRFGEIWEPSEDKPLHVIVFAGHRVDAPVRAEPRFPAEKEDHAKNLIRDALKKVLKSDYRYLGLASAAPGADILFHEICDEFAIPTKLCLPIPFEDYARLTFEKLDAWRSRFIDLRKAPNHEILELSDREGLPRWLYGNKIDFWKRGNRWVMQMALSSDADKITLIALWDGKSIGDALRGTAHMVNLARNAGTVRTNIIDAKQLLA